MIGDRPTIAAIIPTCDRPDVVRSAIRSVIKQTRSADEIIVVDNGSESVVDRVSKMKVTVCRIEPKAGVSRARNVGVALSTAEYLAFLDDDDTWTPNYLEVMENALKANPDADLLLGRLDKVSGGKRVVHKYVRDLKNLHSQLLYMNPGVGGPNLVVKRNMFDQIGGFDEKLRNADDRGFVLDALKADAVVVTVPEAAAIMGETENYRLRDRDGQLKTRRYFMEKYRDQMDMGAMMCNLGLVHLHTGAEARHGWRRMWFDSLGRVEVRLGRLLGGLASSRDPGAGTRGD